jgi:hypothetical protein
VKNPFLTGVSLRTRKPKAAAPAAAAAPIGLKEIAPGDAEGVGIVKGIRMGGDYGPLSSAQRKLAQVTVQFGEDPPKLTRQQRDKMDYDELEAQRPSTSTFDVPPSMAKGLAIGDRVKVCIEKVSA